MTDGLVHSSYGCLIFLVGEWESRYACSPDCVRVLFELFCLLGALSSIGMGHYVILRREKYFDVWK
jgi:hypothetical protein